MESMPRIGERVAFDELTPDGVQPAGGVVVGHAVIDGQWRRESQPGAVVLVVVEVVDVVAPYVGRLVNVHPDNLRPLVECCEVCGAAVEPSMPLCDECALEQLDEVALEEWGEDVGPGLTYAPAEAARLEASRQELEAAQGPAPMVRPGPAPEVVAEAVRRLNHPAMRAALAEALELEDGDR